ncbi:TPA: phage tail tip fiber protein [Aeromonas veronii]
MSRDTFRASSTQQGLTENMQILTGQKGDRLDKALTLREAAAIGMINLRRNGNGVVVPELPPDKPTDPEWSGVQTPTAPVNVTADGAFHTITLTWDAPSYKGHAFAEIWRSSKDNVSTAVRVGTTLANVYSDSVGKGFKAFYWVRFVNKNSMEGPYHSTGGLYAKTSRDIQDIIDELDGQIKLSHFDAWLKQDYEGVKETAASLESGVGSMWAVKASAGEIKAGIGLVAKSDGTSQVFLSASQVFVYDPNNPNGSTAPLLAIDQGKTVIQEALIRKATIQIIHSEKITADSIKAGVSISAPLITGGQFDMGNAFMSGGAAGFGKGGPYSGWNWGWHTIIYADGSIYTNKLNAEGGYVRNMTIGNCTIDQDCVVRGTVYAERIVGDITKMFTYKDAFTVPAYGRARNLILVLGGITFSRLVYGAGVIGLNLHVYLNGNLIETETVTIDKESGGGRYITVTVNPFIFIPANVDATISFGTSAYGNGVLDGPEYNITSKAVWLMALT